MLRRFAKALPGHAVCDLSKAHLDAVLTSETIADFSAKSRNHHRAAIKQWLQWCVRKDYLPVTHRLFEADAMRREHADNGEIEFYTPKEFRALLETAEGPMRAMVAIGGLAGLRTAEILRLTWGDVFRVPGHIEITAGKSKTRQRRLVEVCPALSAWLDDYRQLTGKVCPITAASVDVIWQQQFLKLCDAAKVSRKRNGLRHGFCSFHFALHSQRELNRLASGQFSGHDSRALQGACHKGGSGEVVQRPTGKGGEHHPACRHLWQAGAITGNAGLTTAKHCDTYLILKCRARCDN